MTDRVQAALAAILASCALAYAGPLDGPFILDDLAWLPPGAAAAKPLHPDTMRRPVALWSFALNAAAGAEPAGYRLTNLLIHAAVAVALFALLLEALTTQRLRDRMGSRAIPIALAVGALWVAHPLASEPVLYVINRTESLMALFYVLTLLCAAASFDSPRPAPWIALAIASCALGMGSKEVMVSAPIVALGLDRAAGAGSFAAAIKKRWLLHGGLASTWLILAALFVTIREGSQGFSAISPLEYLYTQAHAIAAYLGLAFAPVELSIVHDQALVTRLGDALVPGALVLALLAAALIAWRSFPALGLPAVAFFLILAPSSSFVPIVTELMAERRMYLPLAALLVLVVLGADELLRWLGAKGWIRRPGAAGSIALGAAVIALALTTRARALDYRSDLSIWQDAVEKAPRSHVAQTELATAFARRGEHARAVEHYRLALESWPRHELPSNRARTTNNLANSLREIGRAAEAVDLYREAIALAPAYAPAYFNLGVTLLEDGRAKDAIGPLRRAVELRPDDAKTVYNLALALERTGDLDGALEHAERAQRLAPGAAPIEEALGRIKASRPPSGTPPLAP